MKKIDILKLGQDLYEVQNVQGYDKLFRVKATSMDNLNPFRAWINFNNEWWPLKITLDTYPIITRPRVAFEGRIPPCPRHPKSWHPNVFDDGRICWGDVQVFPEMRIGGLLHMLYGMVHNPNHSSAVPDRCSAFASFEDDLKDVMETARERFKHIANVIENADRILKEDDRRGW